MDPFDQMNQRMQQMHREMMSDFPFMGGDVFGAPYRPSPEGRMYQRSTGRANGPQIEEIEDDVDAPAHSGGQQPKVEEPDDGTEQRYYREAGGATLGNSRAPQLSRHGQFSTHARHDPLSMFGAMNQMMNFASMNSSAGTTSYSYSSFSSSGGPNGVSYHESSSTRMGPGGVLESKHSVSDGRTGEQRMRLTRGIQDRQRTWERARQHGKNIHSTETMKGIHSQDEAQRFDQEWHARASQNLMPARGERRSTHNANRYGLAAPGHTSHNAHNNAPIDRQRSRALPHSNGDRNVRFM